MKSTLLIAAMAAGLTLTAMDASAAGRGQQHDAPDFATLDTDGSGTVTVAEIEAAGQARFDAIDTDGNGALSLEEMMAARDGDATRRASEHHAPASVPPLVRNTRDPKQPRPQGARAHPA